VREIGVEMAHTNFVR